MLLNPLNGNSLTQRFSFLLDSKARYLYNECLPPPLPSHKKKKDRKKDRKKIKGMSGRLFSKIIHLK